MATITASSDTQTLTGTSSDDTYIIKSIYNKFVEPNGPTASFGGIDTIQTNVLNSLGVYGLESWRMIENLTYSGTVAATLKGNDADNVIKANATKSTADTLYGGKGNDKLYGYAGADNLQGGDGDDSLYAGADTDIDVLIGGTGNDVYYEVTNNDKVIETVRGGFDTIFTNEKGGRYLDLRNFANIEGLTYTSATAATLRGNAAGNVINASKSTGAVNLFGYAGDDKLYGGTAADKMTGGTGNDVYFANVVTDTITEVANEGNDTIIGAYTTIAGTAHATTIENIVYTGAANIAVSGNSLHNLVVGGAGANTVNGANGNDVVLGGAGRDTVQGGTGNDVLYGGGAAGVRAGNGLSDAVNGVFIHEVDGVADTLVGGAGSDLYLVDEDGDTITELATDKGTDVILARVDYSLQAVANVEALVLEDNYTAITAPSAWLATGSARADVIIGNSGENYITGGAGDDILAGDVDGHSYWSGGTNDDPTVTDVVDGGDGNDILLAMSSYLGDGDDLSSAFEFNNVDNVLLGGAGNDFYIDMTGNAEIEDTDGVKDILYLMTSDDGSTKNGIETIVLAGGDAASDARALAALNKVRAVADLADRQVYEGTSPYVQLTTIPTSAAIKVVGNELANFIYGNGNDNDLAGGAGDDTLYGGAGNDILRGDGRDTLVGGIGDDVYVIDGGDIIQEAAGGGTDMIRSATLKSYAAYANIEGLEYTGSDNVTLQNGASNNTVDRLYGGSGNDTINGFGGNDDLRGNQGNDTINGGDGADTVFGGLGMDVLNGGAGNDTLYADRLYGFNDEQIPATPTAGELSNTIHGDAGADTIYGGTAADKLYGDADNDVIYGGLGADTIDGGDGEDELHANAEGYLGGDAGVTNTISGGAGDDEIDGAAGADVLSGGGDDDTVNGYDGNDKIGGDAGQDQLFGGKGTDTIDGGADDDSLYGGDDNDTLKGGTGDDSLSGDNGNDTLDSGAGDDQVRGGDGNDTILADADGTDNISGGKGDDTIYAGTIVTGLSGLSGQDEIYGDEGFGAATGKDTFRFAASSLSAASEDIFETGHLIKDFVQGLDKIELGRALVGNGDLAIDNGTVKATAGGTFSSAAELVIVSANIDSFSTPWSFDSVAAADVIGAIGKADKAFTAGDQRLFVVDDNLGSAVFQFTSKNADAIITADELELVTVVIGKPDLTVADFGVY